VFVGCDNRGWARPEFILHAEWGRIYTAIDPAFCTQEQWSQYGLDPFSEGQTAANTAVRAAATTIIASLQQPRVREQEMQPHWQHQHCQHQHGRQHARWVGRAHTNEIIPNGSNTPHPTEVFSEN